MGAGTVTLGGRKSDPSDYSKSQRRGDENNGPRSACLQDLPKVSKATHLKTAAIV